ncbi:MAG: hypothetical protein HOP06_03475 [Methylotenera sp.]|nr:hypothetical protein [Methylotenera sp.]
MFMPNKIKPNKTQLTIAVVAVIIVLGIAWWQQEQAEQRKLASERLRISAVFRQAGMAAAKIQQTQAKPALDEVMGVAETSADAELAQAKLWQTLPKEKREILSAESIKAGLADAPSVE